MSDTEAKRTEERKVKRDANGNIISDEADVKEEVKKAE